MLNNLLTHEKQSLLFHTCGVLRSSMEELDSCASRRASSWSLLSCSICCLSRVFSSFRCFCTWKRENLSIRILDCTMQRARGYSSTTQLDDFDNETILSSSPTTDLTERRPTCICKSTYWTTRYTWPDYVGQEKCHLGNIVYNLIHQVGEMVS